MKQVYRGLLIISCLSMYIGCAKVQFNDVPCEANSSCPTVTPEGQVQTGSKDGGKKAVDILFVVDNSGSMSTEQNAIANRFSNFIQTLDSQGLDYRIGIITTDVSASENNVARPINGNGALQDGKLIKFPNGNFYLTNQVSDRVAQFASTIKRQETLTCEAYLQTNPTNNSAYDTNCPSSDERGIYAANLFLQNQSGSFVRPEAHFSIVFLADEDIRSGGYASTSSLKFRLTTEDLPQTLISRIQALAQGKSHSIHSIIVRPGSLASGVSAQAAADRIAQSFVGAANGSQSNAPSALMPGGDSSCLATQNGQTNNVKGSYGYLYALATRISGGIEGDVCASDYGSQLNNIGFNITAQVNDIELGCPNPKVLSVDFSPSSGAPSWTLEGTKIKFSSTLPANMTVNYSWKCLPVN